MTETKRFTLEEFAANPSAVVAAADTHPVEVCDKNGKVKIFISCAQSHEGKISAAKEAIVEASKAYLRYLNSYEVRYLHEKRIRWLRAVEELERLEAEVDE